MKIAFVSDNGSTISRHFGRARQFIVVQIAEGREVAREIRVKGSCHGHHGDSSADHHDDHAHDHHDGDHHDDHHDDHHHDDMLAAVADCAVVIAGGMGAGMDQRLRAAGLRTIRTRLRGIDETLQAYLAGALYDEITLVHATH